MASIEAFTSGATRNLSEDKPDYEGFLSPVVLEAYGEYMHVNRYQKDGTIRASDNWQQGIPINNYIKSLVRHVFELWYLHRTGVAPLNKDKNNRPFTKQELACAIMFNIMGYLKETIAPAPINEVRKNPLMTQAERTANKVVAESFDHLETFRQQAAEQEKRRERTEPIRYAGYPGEVLTDGLGQPFDAFPIGGGSAYPTGPAETQGVDTRDVQESAKDAAVQRRTPCGHSDAVSRLQDVTGVQSRGLRPGRDV